MFATLSTFSDLAQALRARPECAALVNFVNTNLSDTQDEILLRACGVARIAEDLRAQDVTVLDLREVTSICDFFVIATGASTRLMRAVVEEVNKQFKSDKWPFRQLEGAQNDQWILADFGDLILHMFHPEARELYDLEGLWADAPSVDWHEVLGIDKDRGL